MRRRRFRTWAKWACTLAAVVMLGVAVASRWYACHYAVLNSRKTTFWSISLGNGILWLWAERARPTEPAIWQLMAGWHFDRHTGWWWGLADEVGPRGSWFDWHHGILWFKGRWIRTAGVSLIYPLLLTTIPAAMLWYTDRCRGRPGLCESCNYDRRGLAAGARCPECGTVSAHARGRTAGAIRPSSSAVPPTTGPRGRVGW